MRRQLLAPLVAAAAGLACAAQQDATEELSEARSEAKDAAKAEEPNEDEQPAATAQASEQTLADFERDLATNRLQLRELGVELPASVPARDGDGEDFDGVSGAPPPEADNKDKAKPDVAEKPSGNAPARRPRSSPAKKGSGGRKTEAKSKTQTPAEAAEAEAEEEDQRARGGTVDETPLFDEPGDGSDTARPAKAAEPPPVGSELEAAGGRCPQICELSEVTCELSEQICILADRHRGEDEYAAACERATVDCDVAREACRDCVD